jgi:hypothetical protein
MDLKDVLGEIETGGGSLHDGRFLPFVDCTKGHSGTSMPQEGAVHRIKIVELCGALQTSLPFSNA